MKKSVLITFLFLIVLAFSVSGLSAGGGSIYVREKGNTGLGSSADPITDYTAYSINYPSILSNYSNSSYSACNIGASATLPIVVDFNFDGYGDILTSSSNIFYLYNRDCELMTSFTPNVGSTKYNPVIDNPDGDNYINIYIGNNSALADYEFNDDTIEFEFISVSNKNNVLAGNYVCPFLSNYCYAPVGSVGGNMYMTKIDLNNMLVVDYGLVGGTNGAVLSTNLHNGLHSYRNVYAGGGYYYRMPILFVDDTSNDLTLAVRDTNNATLGSATIQAMTGTSANLLYYDAFYAKLGNNIYLFVSYVVNNDVSYDYVGHKILDISSLMELYANNNFTTINKGFNMVSNWVVGDFNQNGDNEACFLYGYGYAPGFINKTNNYFTCLESASGVETNIDVTDIMSINHIAMADFVSNNDYSEIVTCEGIFQYNGSHFTKILDTDIDGNCTGDVEVFRDGSSGFMTALYTDSTQGFLIRSSEVGSNCGDGICGLYENPYNCLEDCNITTDETAGLDTNTASNNASNCASGYIEYGKCALKPFKMGCDADSECLSNSCVNGICDDSDVWTKFDNAKDQLYGDSDEANNFLSLIIVLGVGIFIAMQGGIFVSLGWIVLSTIFFTIVGWLSAFFLVGMILLGLILLVLGVVIKGSG